MPDIDAKTLVNRTAFISESDEQDMRDYLPGRSCSYLYEGAFVHAKHPNNNFIALSMMLKSDIPKLKRLIDWSGEKPTIETDDLVEADFPNSVICNNFKDYENVSDEQFRKIRKGDKVKAKVQMIGNSDGEVWLRGRILEIVEKVKHRSKSANSGPDVAPPKSDIPSSGVDRSDPRSPSQAVVDMYGGDEELAHTHWCNTH